MKQPLRFVLALVAGFLLCSAVVHLTSTRETRSWFEKELSLRADLVLGVARPQLATHWEDQQVLSSELTRIARVERILGAQACGYDGQTLAQSQEFPVGFRCELLRERIVGSQGSTFQGEAASGPVFVSIAPVGGGVLVLVQDMGFVARREGQTGTAVWIVFAVLALGATLVMLLALRSSLRTWTNGVRSFLRGDADHTDPHLLPLMEDARAMVERVSQDATPTRREGRWDKERLKETLKQNLDGERIVIMANREPYIHERTESGEIVVRHPASGLVTALEPVMRACSGLWVAHGSGSADRDTVDSHDRVRVPPGEESYMLRRVWLNEAEEQGYYYGFSNEGLWPLCHLAHARPEFRADDFAQYKAVNQRFADAVCREVDVDDPVVLVQDYHFALAPRMIREQLPRATVLTFWHIPWPNAERFGICPWREEILHGLLGSSILGFHTQQHCNNFLDGVDGYLEARIDRAEHAVVRKGRSTLVRPYPISIEWPARVLDQVPSVKDCRAEVFARLGLAENAWLGVGVDRLDYTKGIEERLMAVERALERFPELRGRFTFAQVAAPSRTRIPRYREVAEAVERVAARVNERFGAPGYRPVVLLREHHDAPDVFRYYRAADLCYVSSLHDGMNLVAKEFVAARDDEQGVLVLSHFTGAARELPESLIVNPYDIEGASTALAHALHMSRAEQRQRMRAMRSLVSELNIYRWAGRMLADAAQLRRRERVLSRAPYRFLSPNFARP